MRSALFGIFRLQRGHFAGVVGLCSRTGGAALNHPSVPEGTAADQSVAALCKAEGANGVTTSNTKCITLHLLLTGIDGMHYPMKLLLLILLLGGWGGGALPCVMYHADVSAAT